jgi:heptosyltransferase-2
MQNERVLVVHVAGIGDAAVASTVVERLRAERPGAEITWLCGTAAAPVVELFDGISRVVTVDQERLYHGNPVARASEIMGVWGRLGRAYDRVIILHPDPRYRILVAHLVGVPKAHLSRARHGEMNPVPARFLGDEYARLAGPAPREHIGPIERCYAMADVRPRLGPGRPRARPRVSIVAGGARNALRDDPLRRWPVEGYAEVASGLVGDGFEVVLLGSRSDDWVRPAFAGIDVVDRIGALSLRETLEALRDSDLVVTHDTGPMHLARLVRAPLLALFGPTIPAQVLSIDHTVTVLWGGAHLACRPCFDGRNFARCASNLCLKSVTSADVLAAARRVLAGERAQPVPALLD